MGRSFHVFARLAVLTSLLFVGSVPPSLAHSALLPKSVQSSQFETSAMAAPLAAAAFFSLWRDAAFFETCRPGGELLREAAWAPLGVLLALRALWRSIKRWRSRPEEAPVLVRDLTDALLQKETFVRSPLAQGPRATLQRSVADILRLLSLFVPSEELAQAWADSERREEFVQGIEEILIETHAPTLFPSIHAHWREGHLSVAFLREGFERSPLLALRFLNWVWAESNRFYWTTILRDDPFPVSRAAYNNFRDLFLRHQAPLLPRSDTEYPADLVQRVSHFLTPGLVEQVLRSLAGSADPDNQFWFEHLTAWTFEDSVSRVRESLLLRSLPADPQARLLLFTNLQMLAFPVTIEAWLSAVHRYLDNGIERRREEHRDFDGPALPELLAALYLWLLISEAQRDEIRAILLRPDDEGEPDPEWIAALPLGEPIAGENAFTNVAFFLAIALDRLLFHEWPRLGTPEEHSFQDYAEMLFVMKSEFYRRNERMIPPSLRSPHHSFFSSLGAVVLALILAGAIEPVRATPALQSAA